MAKGQYSLETDVSPIKFKILVISKQKDIGEIIRGKLLEQLGEEKFYCQVGSKKFPLYEVVCQSDIEKGINVALTDRDIDVVILDITIKSDKIDGFSALFEIKQRNKYLPVITLLPPKDEIEIRHYLEAIRLNADAFLTGNVDDVCNFNNLLKILSYVISPSDWKTHIPRFPNIIWERNIKISADLKKQYEFILKKLFPNKNVVFVKKKVSVGKGGGEKFWVRPDDDNFRFVKIGLFFNMYEEKDNYDRYVDGFIDNYSGRIPYRPVRAGALAGIAYTPVGSPVNYLRGNLPSNLGEFIQLSSVREVEKVFNILFREILSIWYDGENVKYVSFNPWKEYLLMGLPSALTIRFEGFFPYKHRSYKQLDNFWENVKSGEKVRIVDRPLAEIKRANDQTALFIFNQDRTQKVEVVMPSFEKNFLPKLHIGENITLCGTVIKNRDELFLENLSKVFGVRKELFKKPKVSICGSEFYNPVYWYKPIINKIIEKDYKVKESIIHGDLNLGNVMVETGIREDKVWLVDFAKVRRGNTVFDFIKFETDLKYYIVADRLEDLRIKEEDKLGFYYKNFESKLLSERDKKFQTPSFSEIGESQRHRIQKYFNIISCLRGYAFGHSHYTLVDFFCGLMLFNIGYLKYLRQDNRITGLKLLFVSSSVACEILLSKLGLLNKHK